MGREEEGASSLRPELAAIDRVLQTVDIAEDLLILSDCQTALTEIQKWIGEGLRPYAAAGDHERGGTRPHGHTDEHLAW